MSKVDWSLAPEGATHYGVAANNRICWYAVKSECRYDYAYQNEGYHAEKWTPSGGAPGHQPLIARPQPKPWSGPEDGLPPVGIACERRFPSVTASSWQGGIILAHGSKKIFFRDNCGDEWAHSFDDVEFRAFRTTAQIAAEKRETAIREIMDVADVDCRVTAARLVDAGFKREVV